MSIVSKFGWKWIYTLGFIAHSILKGFNQKFPIRSRCYTEMAIIFESSHHEILQKYVVYVYVKSKKVLRVYMHAPLQCQTKYRGWCKFASTPPPRNRVKITILLPSGYTNYCLWYIWIPGNRDLLKWLWRLFKTKVSYASSTRSFLKFQQFLVLKRC